MESKVFYEITSILAVAFAVGLVGTLLRQPLVVSFIAVGILVGPAGLNLVADFEQMELLAQMGIALLLFVVGLKLDLQMIRKMGPVALATGLGQILFTSLGGFVIARALGMPVIPAVYVAVALTFSSTIIIVKLLSDKREIDSLHGRIAVGFLIVQDIGVVLAMIALSALRGPTDTSPHILQDILLILGKGLLFMLAVAVMMTVILPRMLRAIARSRELMLLFAVVWAVLLASVGDLLGFSKEVGAFVAGVSLASTPYRESISTRLVTLRDFLLLFFFIDLGAHLDLSLLGAQITPALVFSVFVLVGNPLIVMIIMGLMGYRKRTGFLCGLTVAQISEFSLILVGLGYTLGHLNQETVGLVTLVGLITIGLSTYMIIYSGPLYNRISPLLAIFERKIPYREKAADALESLPRVDVILFGLGNYGREIAKHLQAHGKQVVGVDFDPELSAGYTPEGYVAVYGDAEDPELLEHLPLGKADWVLSALPGLESNLTLLQVLRDHAFTGRVALSARRPDDALLLAQAGADRVLRPFVDAAELAADGLSSAMDQVSEASPWPADIIEVRIQTGALSAGKTISELPLRAETGALIVAVSRAGVNTFDPDPEFRLQVGDRLVVVADPGSHQQVTDFLQQRVLAGPHEASSEFAVREFAVAPDSPWAGQTLARLDFRRTYGVTVLGIQRADQRLMAPTAQETIQPGDQLLIAGTRSALENCGAHCDRGRPSILEDSAPSAP
jgi:Kef-type K+ transport system membrane component KefB/Trk K+ transport system NAD-binding subunit